MFTVKATYRGECRKITFPECSSFPSFDQLYHQLYRVFPISHNFFLSKLLFSPDSSKSRILIAQEVHSAEQYTNCVSRYSAGRYPNPLLKFSVFEETPHKLPSNSSPFSLPQLPSQRSTDSSAAPHPQNLFGTPPIQFGTVSAPPIPFSHIPPPPIIFSTMRSSPQVPIVTHSRSLTPSQQPQSSAPAGETKPLSCCAATQRREEVKDLISNLRSELARIVSDLNDMTRTEAPPVPSAPHSPPCPAPKPMESPVFPALCQFNFCAQCGVIKQGPWYHCGKCDNKICVSCHDASSYSSCLVATGPHVWDMSLCPSCPTPSQPVLPGWNNSSPSDSCVPGLPSMTATNAVETSQPNIWSPTLPNLPSVPTAEPRSFETENAATGGADDMPPPRVHVGVLCDVCHLVIEGVRHKCLDCADYDLCTTCISSGSAERHNPFHEFIDITEPGRVVVHTVFSGNGERDSAQSNRQPPVTEPAVPAPHSATCDLCDSRIRGDRYKCVDCPDFDTCQSCFCITHEQHPHHAFVKLGKPDDFIRRRELERPAHFATCNSCDKRIFGVRYKCMHSDCPDFDLCENCEALPIAVHPRAHPLLKLRDATTIIPTLRAEPLFGSTRPQARDNSIDRSVPSISENGQIRNAVEDLVYQPPSPFFFRSETGTGGCNSPTEYHRPLTPPSPPPFSHEPLSPPLSIPGALPNAFNLPLFTPTSPILQSPILPQTEEPQRRSPSPSPPTPLWKRMSLPPLPPPPPVPYNITPVRRNFRAEMSESLRQNLSWHRRFSQVDTSTQHSEFDRVFMPPAPSRPFDDHDSVPSPPLPGEWRPFPTVPSRHGSQDSLRGESSHQMENQSRFEDQPITLPPIRSTDSSGLWPEGFQEMRHLMNSIPSFGREFRSFFEDSRPVANENTLSTPFPEESPLGREALLNSPPPTDRPYQPENAARSLAAILNNRPDPVETKPTFVEDRSQAEAAFPELPDLNSSTAQVSDFDMLIAEFVADRSVPDGQEFPPGAEFMKSWSMRNTGRKAWPKDTELVFVAGEDLSSGEKGKPIKVGTVQPGETIDLWTGELKAPDVPGKYVGYYRLRDEMGNLFGDSIWLDIIVSETFHRSPPSLEENSASEEYSSLSSSSVIMPRSAPSVPSVVTTIHTRSRNSPYSSVPGSPVTALSVRSDVDDVDVLETISNPDSEASSVSLVSVPSSSSEDEDEELYRDCRSSIRVESSTQTLRAPPSQAQQVDEYVVLYDEATSSEEE